jgi:hypothetical protein
VPCGRKSAHIDTNFGDDDARHRTADGGNGHQSVDGRLKGRQRLAQARFHVAHGDLERIELGQVQPQQKSMMRRHAALQCRDDSGPRRFQPSPAEIGEAFGMST